MRQFRDFQFDNLTETETPLHLQTAEYPQFDGRTVSIAVDVGIPHIHIMRDTDAGTVSTEWRCEGFLVDTNTRTAMRVKAAIDGLDGDTPLAVQRAFGAACSQMISQVFAEVIDAE
jgi:hypothetical protein